MWFKVDDGFAFHAKRLKAGLEAVGAWTVAGSWCGANLTDGYIPPEVAEQIAPPRVWAKLRAAGLVEEPSGGRPGHQIHDFLVHNPSAAKVRAERDAWRARQRKARGLPPESLAVSRRDSGGDTPVSPGVPIPIPIPIPDTHTPPAGAREEPRQGPREPSVEEPALAAEAGPEVAAIAEELRRHKVITTAAHSAPAGEARALLGLAETIAGRAIASARPLAWVLTAVSEAARDLGAVAAGEGPAQWPNVAGTVARFADRARAPRVDAPANDRGAPSPAAPPIRRIPASQAPPREKPAPLPIAIGDKTS